MPRKCILILLDGLGDRSYPSLGNMTPLQAAHTPELDKLAKAGINGLYHAATIGQALPSENAHFAMFGYDMEDFPGRGALEAIGAGIALSEESVALLSHFVSLSEKNGTLFLDKGKPEADKSEIAELIDHIRTFHKGGIRLTFHPTGGIRGILILEGDVSPYITDSDPFINGRPLVSVLPWDKYKADDPSQKTARFLMYYLSWTYHRLNLLGLNEKRKKGGLLPLNGLTTQRAGRLKNVTPFPEKFGLRGLILASGMVYWGLGGYIGMDIGKVKDTRDPGSDIFERIMTAREKLDQYDFVHVHTKGPDEAAHTKDPLRKKTMIEALDRGIGRALETAAGDPQILIIITADHSTPSGGPMIHSGETIPLLMLGGGIRQDQVEKFDEVSVAGGGLGNIRGKELMYLILNHLERSKLSGLMDTPVDQPYWPGNYEPFKLIRSG